MIYYTNQVHHDMFSLQNDASQNMPHASSAGSSIFSNDDSSYDFKIKEIEEYYMKTLLSDDTSKKVLANPQMLNNNYSLSTYYNNNSSNALQQLGYSSFDNLHDINLQKNTSSLNFNYTPHPDKSLDGFILPSTSTFNITSTPLSTVENMQLQPISNNKNDILIESSKKLNDLLQEQKQTVVTSQESIDNPVVNIINNSKSNKTNTNKHSSTNKSRNSHNNNNINKQLFKTELCEAFTTKGSCKYGNKCQFAHGLNELHFKSTNDNYRTKPCINWEKLGYCPYGKRCQFKHGDDIDIKIYVNAGKLSKNSNSDDVPKQKKKNLQPNLKKLEGMKW